MLASLKAQEEIAGVFGVDAEIVDRSLRIGFGVCGQPSFYEYVSKAHMWRRECAAAYQYQLY